MDEMKGIQIIRSLRSKWILFSVLADLLTAAGIGFILGVLTSKMFGWSVWWSILHGAVVFAFLLFVRHAWQIKENTIAQLLNEKYPQLQESAGLLLQPPSSLNMLEQLQYKKTVDALQTIDAPLSVSKKIISPVLILVIMLITGIVLGKSSLPGIGRSKINEDIAANQAIKKEIIPAQVSAIDVVVRPPSYTAKPMRQQHAFNLVAEEGSLISWQLQTTITATAVKFIFNDKVQFELHADAAHTRWNITREIDSTGFYQVSIDGKVSGLYKIEAIRDKSPVINIVSPKQYSTIEYGEPEQVKLNTAIMDDYGVKDAFIAATIASGSGEAVKFKEQKISLQGFAAGKEQYQLQQTIALRALGMQPGDELYFYVQATDNHRQETRSDVHIVHLPDTAQLMSMEGLGNSVTLKPEYFRSQRQIIIDAEQLLKDRDTIGGETFKNRSNNLGIDQKLLRLRYGKFLGEEAESGEVNSDGLNDIANFSDADKVRDAFTDKHDNSEDATYLDPETKKQLRATLTEMWSSELQLRTFKPKDALPFAYKALRLLKDLQQKSRAYVAKANFKTTPLDLKKRLTGDLTKINDAQLQKDIIREPDLQLPVRNALSMLERIGSKDDKQISAAILQQANLRLHAKAIQQPSLYLDAVEAMKKIIASLNDGNQIPVSDIATAQHGLQQLLAEPDRLPSAAKSNAKQGLSKQYFDNLQNRQP